MSVADDGVWEREELAATVAAEVRRDPARDERSLVDELTIALLAEQRPYKYIVTVTYLDGGKVAVGSYSESDDRDHIVEWEGQLEGCFGLVRVIACHI